MELNPNHPTTKAISDHWHKIAALIMHKLGTDHIVITTEDILSMMEAEKAIAAQELKDGLHIFTLTMEDARSLAAQEGGLPH